MIKPPPSRDWRAEADIRSIANWLSPSYIKMPE
jgi:hypothetical protein